MHARSTTVQAHRDSIDAGIAHLRDEVLPALLDVEGCSGLSLLVDRESGRCIATSSWQSEEAMHAGEDRVRPIRERASESFGGVRPQVDEWEIAVLHRDHPAHDGACVRVTWMRFRSGQADRGIETYKTTALPAAELLEGFCSASLLVDRESSIAVSSVTYNSAETMRRSRERAGSIRASAAREADLEILEVGEFELALAHLRVPEMA